MPGFKESWNKVSIKKEKIVGGRKVNILSNYNASVIGICEIINKCCIFVTQWHEELILTCHCVKNP